MGALRETIAANPAAWLACGGLVIGLLFGAIIYATNFCTMGAIADVLNLGDARRLRAWVLAIATAMLGTQALQWAGIVDLSQSMYLSPSLNWVGNVGGGFMFGFGMVFAGGCASRNLARAGGGDLEALLVLVVLGIFASLAMGGILGPLRAAVQGGTSFAVGSPSQSVGDVFAPALGFEQGKATLIAALAIAGLLLVYCLASADFRRSPRHIWSGLGVGLVVVAGWALTGLANDEMILAPMAPASLTYVRPTAEAIHWLKHFTAEPLPGFGAATVVGAILGAFVMAVAKRRFRITTFTDAGQVMRSLSGAALMGIGGVLAMGCTIGQGVTGLSTLALGSFLTFAAIVAGAIYAIKTLERKFA